VERCLARSGKTKKNIILTFSRHKDVLDNFQVMCLFGFESKLTLTNKIGLNKFQVIGLFG
jgi:hypothetical protein